MFFSLIENRLSQKERLISLRLKSKIENVI